jgi:hypothetical protein
MYPQPPLPGSPQRSCDPGLVIAIPPLADQTAAYMAAQMRRADEIAAAFHERSLVQAGIGSRAREPVIARARRAVGTWLIDLGHQLGGIPAAGVAGAGATAVPSPALR